jgi:hypothetical protein
MTPVQFIKLGIGDEGIQLPLYRLPYAGSADASATPGGFFTTKDGELGIAIDARLDAESAQRLVAQEIEKSAPVIAALLASKAEKADKTDKTDAAKKAKAETARPS